MVTSDAIAAARSQTPANSATTKRIEPPTVTIGDSGEPRGSSAPAYAISTLPS
jgi:hypothetical protein